MFGENFEYDPNKIAPYTRGDGGDISLLDFPLRGQLQKVFEHPDSDFGLLDAQLYLEHGPYRNPYELVTFYDNHDMARLNASDAGFIDANNWLFTARGIPVVYYGSETGFMRGRPEHAGNRNYFGQQRVDAAPTSPIHQNLRHVANLRKRSIALQKGLQLNVELKGDRAIFYRVYENDGTAQTALVLLNKGDHEQTFEVRDYLQPGAWRDGFSSASLAFGDRASLSVPAHGVKVYFYNHMLMRADVRARLAELMANKSAETH